MKICPSFSFHRNPKVCKVFLLSILGSYLKFYIYLKIEFCFISVMINSKVENVMDKRKTKKFCCEDTI